MPRWENFKSLFAGDAWESPSKVVGSLLQSAPSTVVGMGTGGMITHGLIKQGIKGLSPGMAGDRWFYRRRRDRIC